MAVAQRFVHSRKDAADLTSSRMPLITATPYHISNGEEDWTNISCPKQRRRIQNRKAQVRVPCLFCVKFLTVVQRRYRNKLKQRLTHLEYLEETAFAPINSIDCTSVATSNSHRGLQPGAQKPPLSPVPEQFTFENSTEDNPPTTTSLPKPPIPFYIASDQEKYQMYTHSIIRTPDPYSTDSSLLEYIQPTTFCDEPENLFVEDMDLCPLAMSYLRLVNLCMPQREKLIR